MDSYSKNSWTNGGGIPLSAEHLNHMEEGIYKATEKLIELEEFAEEIDNNKVHFGDYSSSVTGNIRVLDSFRDNETVYKVLLSGELYGGTKDMYCLMYNAGDSQILLSDDGQIYSRSTADDIFKSITSNKLDDTDNSVKSNNLADGAVTSAKIAEGAVTRGKIGYQAISDSHQIASGVIKGYTAQYDRGHIAEKTITEYNLADNVVTTEKIVDNAVSSGKIMDRAVGFSKLDKDTMIDTSSNSSMSYALASDSHIPTTGFVKAINEGTKEKIDTEIAQVNKSIDNLFVKKELLVNLSSFIDESTGDYKNPGRYYYSSADKIVGISNDSNYACIPIELKAGLYSVENINPYYSFYLLNNQVVRFGGAENAFISTTFELPIDTTLYVTIRVVSSSNGHETVAIASGDTIPDDISTLGVFSYDTHTKLDSVAKLEEKIPSVITVKKDGTGDFSTLKEAVEYSQTKSDLTIEVYEGTYDLIEEFGDEYFTNLSGTSQRRGLQIGNGVHLIFSSGSKVVCHYQGDNETVKTCFSPFNYIQCTKGFTLENLTLEASNVRYAIHDEAGSSTLNMYRNTYKNCKITIDNSNNEVWKKHKCIGGGLGLHGEIIIENCSFTDMYNVGSKVSAVSYHNVVSEGAKSRIIVTGCYFSDNATFSLAYYGNSTEITEAYVSNCSMTYEPYVRAETSEYTTENVKLIMWNNTINDGASYTAGNGIKIENNTISLNLPVYSGGVVE